MGDRVGEPMPMAHQIPLATDVTSPTSAKCGQSHQPAYNFPPNPPEALPSRSA